MIDDAEVTAVFGLWLGACRRAAILSQEELAERSRLSVRTVRNLERGHTRWPHPESVRRLADALGLGGEERDGFIAAADRRLASAAAGTAAGEPIDDSRPLAGAAAGSARQEFRDSARGRVVPHQLPAGPVWFTGRRDELAVLTGLLDEVDGADGTVVISAVGGFAGVGKTALAVHWAHQVTGRFPDGQLYVNLRGFGPVGAPVDPAEAIRGFLGALGAEREQIPVGLDAQAALYRSLLAGRRALIVLDNARDADQVRPLLPGSSGCLVVVTSRRDLAGLAAVDGARLLNLDVLAAADARELLARRLDPERAAAEPHAVDDLARLCGRLPLALAITAARAAAQPGHSLSALAAELRGERGRLDALDAGDAAASIRAVFSWSTGQLSPAAARAFRLLGLHPGPDISAPAAASLAGCDPAEVCRLLAELTRDSLLNEPVPGRYALHDLLREYAADQAHDMESDTDRQEAIGRVLDHYMQAAYAAAVLLVPSRKSLTVTSAPPRAGVAPERLDGHQQALDWFAAEHHVLAGAVTLAAQTGLDAWAWQIAWAMTDFLDWRGHWQESAALQHIALNCATRLDDSAGEAAVRFSLALNCMELGIYDQARAHAASSDRLFQQLGNLFGQGAVSIALGMVAERQGDYAAAAGHAERALHLFQAVGDQLGQAVALNNAGFNYSLLGEPQRARALCPQALSQFRKQGHRHGEALVWDTLGHAEHHLGHYARAVDCYSRALRLLGALGARYQQACILTRLGDVRHAAGHEQHAWDAWQRALAILEDLHHRDADQVRAKLATTNGDGSPASPPRQVGR